jgi:hypothetical protein
MTAIWISLVLSVLALGVSIVSAWRVRHDRVAKFEAHYRDILKELADLQSAEANCVLELIREETRAATARAKLGLQISGWVTIAAGLGTLVFLRFFLGAQQNVYLCGLIPLFIGIALLASSRLVKTKA